MFPGRTTPALLVFFAPLAEWSVSITCWNTSTASPTRCHWDVVSAKTRKRVENHFTSPVDQSYFYCAETFRLPLSAGEYTYFILLVPNSWMVALKLQIVDPGKPTLENCKREAREGDKVRCVCSTQNEGSPPPAISWKGQGNSPMLLLNTVRREHSKTYTCEMIWGNRTKTVSYDLSVLTDSSVSVRLTTTEGIDEVENEENNIASSLPTEVIVAAAAAVLVLIVATTVIVIIIIRRKRNLSERTGSSSGHSKVELIDMSNDGRTESNMVCDNYAEVMNSVRDEEKSTEHVVYANTGTNEGRQTVEAALYGNVEISQGRETTQVDVYAVVEKNKERQSVQPELYTLVDKQHLKGDSSRFQCERESTSQGDVYAVVNKGANSSSHALSAPAEEMYAQVVKSPK
ncbi:uncharacterized protein LOC112568675 isoform X8 [Pomacea canaliculata]|uniref:uncharacterized protein LOC112568675 isoform X8 n=1 Tax=Pomacea canaliculata TaxID=400727 RepID=UPI000D73603C|nr:uncharacterized protein LOC112568675 isoform X8 [Pomacea canaliculata]XP_025101882.1 uncharacterized protein LOC112568675 isoform X8 [Pomacea canaliculata]